MSTCDCFEKVDAELAQVNGRCAQGFSLAGNKLRGLRFVATVKIDSSKRKAVPNVAMSFCPFCGTKLEEPDAIEVPDVLSSEQIGEALAPLYKLPDFHEINGPTGYGVAQAIYPRDAHDLTVRELLDILSRLEGVHV